MASKFSFNPDVEARLRLKILKGITNMAGDILTLSTPVTPFRLGDLRIRRRVEPIANGVRIHWLSTHAAVQNRGSRRGKPFRHYTTPGTGPGFVQKGIEAVKRNLLEYFK